jgi:hypothetical protein
MMGQVTSDALSAPVPAPGGAVLRPSRTAYGRALRANLWIAIPLLVISLIRLGLNWWLLPFFVVVLLLTLGGVLLYFRNARVEYGDGSYTVVSLFGARRTFQAREATSVVTVTSLLGTGVQGGLPQLIVLGADGAKILRLRGQTWHVDQFTELANDLIAHGVPHDAIPEPITAAALRERYPKAVRWGEAHQIAFGLLLSLVVVVVVLLAVVVMVLTSS